MLRGIASSHRQIVKIAEWLGLMLFFSVALIALWGVLFVSDMYSTQSLKWLQVLQSLGVFLLPALGAVYLWSSRPAEYLHISRLPHWGDIIFAICLVVVALPAINLLAYWNQQMVLPSFLSDLEAWMKGKEDAAMALTERFLQADNGWQLTLNVLIMALLPAICEETCFRGVLLSLFSDNDYSSRKITVKQHVAIWAVAIIFSFVHMQFYGFVPRMLLGALLGYLLVWTDSLWVAIVAHFTNNACSVVAYYVVSHNEALNLDEIDAFGTGSTLWLGILSLIATLVAIVAYHRYKTR